MIIIVMNGSPKGASHITQRYVGYILMPHINDFLDPIFVYREGKIKGTIIGIVASINNQEMEKK